MNDREKAPKKKLLKMIIKLIAPLFPIVGIFAGTMYLCFAYPSYNNVFVAFFGLWLSALDINLIALYVVYLAKVVLWIPITEWRPYAIKAVKLIAIIAYIITAIGIFGGGLVLASYLIYLRAVALGLTKVSAPMTSLEAILTVLLLISLPLLAYVTKREVKKAIQLGREVS